MADELDRDVLSAKEKPSSDSLIVGFNERNLLLQRPHVTKLSRNELEDQYLRLLDYNVELKKYCNKQDEKVKRLATKLLHVVAQKKREVPLSARRDTELQMTISQQQQHITELEQTNQQLLERMTVLRKQLTEHSTLHSAVHCNYPGGLHSSRSPSRHTATTARTQTRISSANSQNLYHSEASSEPVPPPNEDTEDHKPQCPLRDVMQTQRSALNENVEHNQELEQLQSHIALLQQEMERQQQVSNDRISELEEELANTNTLLQKQKVEDNVELIQLKRSLQHSSNQIKERDIRIESLQKEQSKLEESLQQTHKHTDELRVLLSAESKRVADLQEEIKKLQLNVLRPETEAHIKDLERECEMLKQTNLQLTESLKSREASEGEKNIKSEISDIVQKEIEKLEKTKQLQEQERTELTQLMAANTELQAKYNDIVNKHDELEKRLKDVLENPIIAQGNIPGASPMKENAKLEKIEETQAVEKQTRAQQTDDMLETEHIKRHTESKSSSDKETMKPSAQKSINNPASSFSQTNDWLSSYLSRSKSSISDYKMAPYGTVGFKGICLCCTVPVNLPKGYCLCTRNEQLSVLGRRFLQKPANVQSQDSSTSSHSEKDTSDVSDASLMDVTTSELQSSSAKQKEDCNKDKQTATLEIPNLKVGILSSKISRKNTGQNQIVEKENKLKDLRKPSKLEITNREQSKNVDTAIHSVAEELESGFFHIYMQNLELTVEGIAALEQAAPGDPRLFLTWTFFDKELSYTPVKKAIRVTELGSSSVHKVIINDDFLKYLSKESCTVQAHAAVDDISTTIASGILHFSELLTKPSKRIHTTISLRLLAQQNKATFGILHCWFHLSCGYDLAQKIKQLEKIQEMDTPKHKVPIPVPRRSKTSESANVCESFSEEHMKTVPQETV